MGWMHALTAQLDGPQSSCDITMWGYLHGIKHHSEDLCTFYPNMWADKKPVDYGKLEQGGLGTHPAHNDAYDWQGCAQL